MINLSEVVSAWPVVDGWSIAPEGVIFCAAGSRFRVGKKCTAGNRFKAGNWFTVGDAFKAGYGFTAGNWFKAGDGFTAGNWFTVGDGFTVGDRFTVGDEFTVGNWFKAGDGFTITSGAKNSVVIGFADGFWKSISEVDGVAYIGAGCRWFTLADALNHWGNHEEDRSMTMCLLEAAKAIAVKNGWRFE